MEAFCDEAGSSILYALAKDEVVHELPVANGAIQGYRVNSDSIDAPTITDTTDESATETSFTIKMGDNALAPAYGTVSASGTSIKIGSGTASAILQGTDAVFTVGGSKIDIDDVIYEPYTKDQMPEDYLTIYQANLPITLLSNDHRPSRWL